MPVTYGFDDTIVVMRAEGAYTLADLKAATLGALDDSARPEGSVLMFDVRASEALAERTADEVRDMAEFLQRHGDRFARRLAIVAGSDLGYGLMRLGAAHTEQGGITSEVFRDYDAAKRWLLGV
jgi:hypothetical protein